jgi:hypothetical protein
MLTMVGGNLMEYEILDIDSIEILEDFKEEYVYDLEMVDEPHVFFANDILVHNSLYYSIQPFIDNMFIKKGLNINWESKEQLDELAATIDKFVDKVNKYCHIVLEQRGIHSELNRIAFKRECIAKSGIFLAKKRYLLQVFDDENKRPKGGKFKYTGVEVKKKELPPAVIKLLTDFIEGSISEGWNDREIIDAQNEMWNQYKQMSISDIGFYKTLSTPKHALMEEVEEEYEARNEHGDIVTKTRVVEREIFMSHESRSQAQARGCIYYNQLTAKLGLRAKYQEIRKGEKYRYMWVKPNNRYGVDVIAYPADGGYPEEFEEMMSINLTKMYQKQINAPLKKIFEACKWEQFDATDERVINIFDD